MNTTLADVFNAMMTGIENQTENIKNNFDNLKKEMDNISVKKDEMDIDVQMNKIRENLHSLGVDDDDIEAIIKDQREKAEKKKAEERRIAEKQIAKENDFKDIVAVTGIKFLANKYGFIMQDLIITNGLLTTIDMLIPDAGCDEIGLQPFINYETNHFELSTCLSYDEWYTVEQMQKIVNIMSKTIDFCDNANKWLDYVYA